MSTATLGPTLSVGRSVYSLGDEDTISGFHSPDDAVVKFVNLGATKRKLTGIGSVSFASGSWTNAEIESVDVALSKLHGHMGNTKLLETHFGGAMTLQRAGRQLTTLPGNSQVQGWNGSGRIAFADGAFSAGTRNLYATVYHEFGHNWDDPKENSRAAAFRAISEWDHKFDSGDALSGDGLWYYDMAASFARRDNYGQYDPFEDYATTWEAYFMQRNHSATNWYNPLDANKRANIEALFTALGKV